MELHIPDGYLGPITYGILWVVMILIWIVAGGKLKKTLKTRQVPLLAIGAAFSFVIMMFNVPIPGGSTGHAVGGTLIAVVLGPWAATIAISVALIVQAFFFGDGGITAIGANCFNIAFALPFVGYYVYRLIAGNSEATSSRRWTAAGIGSYLGINVAAILTGIELGIQPFLYHTASGQALYSPYPVKIAVPVMAFEHLLFFGFVELLATVLVIKYLQGMDASLIRF